MRIYSNPAPVQKPELLDFKFSPIRSCSCRITAPWYNFGSFWKLLTKKQKSAVSRSMWVRFYRSLINMMTKWLAILHVEPRVSSSNTRYSSSHSASTGSWFVIPGPELFCWKHNLQNQNYIHFVNKHTVSPDLPRFSDISSNRACVSICRICK